MFCSPNQAVNWREQLISRDGIEVGCGCVTSVGLRSTKDYYNTNVRGFAVSPLGILNFERYIV